MLSIVHLRLGDDAQDLLPEDAGLKFISFVGLGPHGGS